MSDDKKPAPFTKAELQEMLARAAMAQSVEIPVKDFRRLVQQAMSAPEDKDDLTTVVRKLRAQGFSSLQKIAGGLAARSAPHKKKPRLTVVKSPKD